VSQGRVPLSQTESAKDSGHYLRQAARYIFAPHSLRFGNYVELALRNEDVDRLAEFIQMRRKREC
jgi:hypothetical protein